MIHESNHDYGAVSERSNWWLVVLEEEIETPLDIQQLRLVLFKNQNFHPQRDKNYTKIHENLQFGMIWIG